MPTPRKLQFNPVCPPWVHVISRCVRRAYLCGTDLAGRDLEHRKGWVEDRLRLIARSAACEVAGYAVMANHLHAVVRMRPDVAAGWSAMEVVRRLVE
jgi:REP element-mobilizing transposase RayT